MIDILTANVNDAEDPEYIELCRIQWYSYTDNHRSMMAVHCMSSVCFKHIFKCLMGFNLML